MSVHGAHSAAASNDSGGEQEEGDSGRMRLRDSAWSALCKRGDDATVTEKAAFKATLVALSCEHSTEMV